MKNYYEILEVDKNASQEVIEKAYRALAKKYHPDLQQGAMQQEYAEKMKIINQAYDVLSNSVKRQEYNQELENEKLRRDSLLKQEQERIMRENEVLNERIRAAQQQAYHDAYIQDMRNRGYKIRYKRSIKDYFRILVTILITAFIFFIIYQIPFVKNFFAQLYEENIIFRAIVNIIKNTFSATF